MTLSGVFALVDLSPIPILGRVSYLVGDGLHALEERAEDEDEDDECVALLIYGLEVFEDVLLFGGTRTAGPTIHVLACLDVILLQEDVEKSVVLLLGVVRKEDLVCSEELVHLLGSQKESDELSDSLEEQFVITFEVECP